MNENQDSEGNGVACGMPSSPESRLMFDQRVRGSHLLGYWMIPSRSDGYREPVPSYGSYLWPWDTMEKILWEAVDHVPKEEAHRRFIGFQHPDLDMGSTPNLMLGAQLLIPGEKAPCHRHTMDAIRFVIQGDGQTATVVEGEAFPMQRGDLITTPNWSWHDHTSANGAPTIWLDGAVAPLIVNLGIGFAEPYQSPEQDVVRPKGWSAAQFGPLQAKHRQTSQMARRPPYRYAWEETRAKLDILAAGPGDPWDAVTVRFSDPETGGSTLATAQCEMTMLRAHEHTLAHRHTHAVVYHVLEGTGTSVVAGKPVDWSEGDTFVVPCWAWHEHRNNTVTPAFLFAFSDEPVMKSLGFDHEERGGI